MKESVLCLSPCLNTIVPEPYTVSLPFPTFVCYSWNHWVFGFPTDPNSMEHSGISHLARTTAWIFTELLYYKHGGMDGWMHGWMDGWMAIDGEGDEWMDGEVDG